MFRFTLLAFAFLACAPRPPVGPDAPVDEPDARTEAFPDDDGEDDACSKAGRRLWALSCREAQPKTGKWGPFCRARYPGLIDADCIASARRRADLVACRVRCLR